MSKQPATNGSCATHPLAQVTVVDLVGPICPIIAEAEILHKIDKVYDLKQPMMVMLNSNWLDFLPAGCSLPSCKQGEAS